LAKILVVDDDPVMQMTVAHVLQQAGHAVVAAGDGAKGLARFQAERFDLPVLDIFMPGMDGFETMRRPAAAAGPADHHDVGPVAHARINAGTGLSDHGNQARGGPSPAQAVQACGSACDGRRLSHLFEPVHCPIQAGP
jgi:CheY-like chemotaxis protein